jgi:hypothetical protein
VQIQPIRVQTVPIRVQTVPIRVQTVPIRVQTVPARARHPPNSMPLAASRGHQWVGVGRSAGPGDRDDGRSGGTARESQARQR